MHKNVIIFIKLKFELSEPRLLLSIMFYYLCINTECIDKNQYCPDWAQVGHCSKSTYVQENCKLSCGSPTACQGTTCVDNYADCPSWESIGHCSLNPTVAKECQKSCNPFCKGNNI